MGMLESKKERAELYCLIKDRVEHYISQSDKFEKQMLKIDRAVDVKIESIVNEGDYKCRFIRKLSDDVNDTIAKAFSQLTHEKKNINNTINLMIAKELKEGLINEVYNDIKKKIREELAEELNHEKEKMKKQIVAELKEYKIQEVEHEHIKERHMPALYKFGGHEYGVICDFFSINKNNYFSTIYDSSHILMCQIIYNDLLPFSSDVIEKIIYIAKNRLPCRSSFAKCDTVCEIHRKSESKFRFYVDNDLVKLKDNSVNSYLEALRKIRELIKEKRYVNVLLKYSDASIYIRNQDLPYLIDKILYEKYKIMDQKFKGFKTYDMNLLGLIKKYVD